MKETTRRNLLKVGAAGISGMAALSGRANAQESEITGLSPSTIASAEKLTGVEYTDAEREQMVSAVEDQLSAIQQLRAVEKPNTLAPAQTFDPRLPKVSYPAAKASSGKSASVKAASDLSDNSTDIAFAPLTKLAGWIRSGAISSRQLTDIYLDRIEQIDPKLKAWIAVMPERARAEADAMDAERASGNYRGPLHGIPYGLKDLFDAVGARTTWGAKPYSEGQPATEDSAVVRKLKEAGAVLLGKTSCGALAYGDIWYGAVTRNPFDPREGSSGSSAGSASSVAAGLCGFAIGTETLGSLVSPSHRCGGAALRPTFGRVSRAGGMALCWSLDKVGPMARSVADLGYVMAAINGYDPDDASSVRSSFAYKPTFDFSGLRIGFNDAWRETASDVELAAFNEAMRLGARRVEFKLPDLPSAPLPQQLLAEAAAAFEELTLSNRDDDMVWQEDPAWPNSFRAIRFVSAIDLIQVDRLRRLWMQAMHEAFEGVDLVIGPNFASGMLTPTNFTGHPGLVMRAGFQDTQPRSIFGQPQDETAETARTPIAISLWAPLFQENTLLSFGAALEDALGVAGDRPSL
ncbi:amidase [Henriciella marina]|uniref:amidase n=1 Tax=Henriciella marina TaxID=453851 RepID=UPI000382C8ED|nr:amidase [Henriciella marina]